MDPHYTNQVETISDCLQELMINGVEIAKKGLLEAVNGWYDYHQKEADKWKALQQMVKNL